MSTSGDLGAVARNLATLPRRALADVAPTVESLAGDAGRRAAPGGVAGRRLGARATVAGDRLTVVAVPAGPWAMLNNGTRPHTEGRRGAVLYGRGWRHPVSGPLRHPGGRGRRVWPPVVTDAGAAASRALALELERTVARGR